MSKPFKFTVVGDPTVGKTCLLVTYANKKFPEEYIPTVFDNYSANILFNDKAYNVSLWDTAGQEEYGKLRLLSYPNTDVFFVCYSVSSRASFNNVASKWAPELKHNCPAAVIILVATKIDCWDSSCVSSSEGQRLGRKIGAVKYIECSAKTQTNLNELFSEAVRVAVRPPKPMKRTCTVL